MERVPGSYFNWLEQRKGAPSDSGCEVPLFTDAQLTGQPTAVGPYTFVNTIAHASSPDVSMLRPAIVLRVLWHFTATPPRLDDLKTHDDHYHGGDVFDEIAALVSLLVGVRLRAGPTSREFHSGGDLRGIPVAYDSKPVPALPNSGTARVVPFLFGAHSLMSVARLDAYPLLQPKQANAVVKAARLFQDAIWSIDADASMSWVLLVSAVEVAAAEWKATVGTKRERVQESFPKLVETLNRSASEEVVDSVVEVLDKYAGATRKFVGFMHQFMPSAPDIRPAQWVQFDFEKSNFDEAMRQIYGYRSRALHGGIAFPKPMCSPPMNLGRDVVPPGSFQEVPFGRASSYLGSVWSREDTPMLLTTFVYIVRGALLRWWDAMVPSEPAQA